MARKLRRCLLIAVVVLPFTVAVAMLVPSEAQAWSSTVCTDLNYIGLDELLSKGWCSIEDKIFKFLDASPNLFDPPTVTFDETSLNPGFTIFPDLDFSDFSAETFIKVGATVNEGGNLIKDVGFRLVGSFFVDSDLTLSGSINGKDFDSSIFSFVGSCDDGESLLCTGEWTGGQEFDLTGNVELKWSMAGFDSISAFAVHFSEAKHPDTSVPEPALATLMGTGLIGLLYHRARSSLRS